MYLETHSKSIAEATDKLYDAKSCDLVFGCPPEALTDAQRDVLYEVLNSYGFSANEDRRLALENLYVNLTDDHIYILEMSDGGDDNIEYYYTELVPEPKAKSFLVRVKDNTYHLMHSSIEGLMDYLVRICGNNPADIEIELEVR